MDVRINEEPAVELVGRNFRLLLPEPLPEGVTSMSADMELLVSLYRKIEPLVAAWEAKG
jgi:hypothetical protein